MTQTLRSNKVRNATPTITKIIDSKKIITKKKDPTYTTFKIKILH
jgi:hypothetical protein